MTWEITILNKAGNQPVNACVVLRLLANSRFSWEIMTILTDFDFFDFEIFMTKL